MSRRATSQIEKHFQMNTVYRRGKQFLDISKMNQNERIVQKKRRSPQKSLQTINIRVNSSFHNSANKTALRVDQYLNQLKHKHRYQEKSIKNEEQENRSVKTVTMYSQKSYDSHRQTSSRIRGPDLSKMPPRQNSMGSRSSYRNEDQFNNYSTNSPHSSAKNIRFALMTPRSQSKRSNNTKSPSPLHYNTIQTSQSYQKNTLHSGAMRCLFDYTKVQKFKNSSRKLKIQQSAKKPKQISIQRLQMSVKQTKANKNIGMNYFYKSTDRQEPSQMNIRKTKNNQYFYERKQVRKLKQDYSYRQKRNEEEIKRLSLILKKKQKPDYKDEMCDYRFFFRKNLKDQKKKDIL